MSATDTITKTKLLSTKTTLTASDWLATNEFADMIGKSVRSVENWRTMGVGPNYYQLSDRIVRYRRDEVIEWINNARKAPVRKYKKEPLTANATDSISANSLPAPTPSDIPAMEGVK
jgi:predicted DNA-binding transcriptional regulator AlpA